MGRLAPGGELTFGADRPGDPMRAGRAGSFGEQARECFLATLLPLPESDGDPHGRRVVYRIW